MGSLNIYSSVSSVKKPYMLYKLEDVKLYMILKYVSDCYVKNA